MLRDANFQRFEVNPLTGVLGAEVRGLDLAADPDDATLADLRRALDQHLVVAVRDQKFTPTDLHRVARRLGPYSGNPVHTPLDGFDDVVRFAREADDTDNVIGDHWHMDLAWLPKPPGIVMLYGDVIPPVGGDTCFTSLIQTYRGLSEGMKSLLRGLTGVHSGRGVYAINAKSGRLGLQATNDAVDAAEAEHPVLCVQPATGRPYVLVNSVIRRFKGMTEAESKPIIDYLFNQALKPEYMCRVRWEQGTLLMWANPMLMHSAIGDYSGYRRVTYRTTVEGWTQVAAPAERPAVAASQAA
jgi:taurine dioxygenase